VTKSQDRVDARRAIQEKAIARRREREQKDERIAKLAVAVNVALKTGRRALEEAEAEAGEALTQMITTESIRVTEAIEWVGDSMLTPREVARLRGLSRTKPSPSDVASSIRELALRQVDGMIVAAQVSMPTLAAISECGIRTVLINQFSAVDGVPSVGPDLYEGARTGVNHLIWRGHTNIGYVGEMGPPDVRERGWRDALTATGLAAGPAAAAAFSREGGYAAGKQLIADENRPTAIFVSSDFQAIGVLRAIHEAGIAIPDEIAVVSFDGSPEAEYTWPALTTVQQPVAEMAEEAVERLVAPTASDAFSRYPTNLIVRQSCGCGMPA